MASRSVDMRRSSRRSMSGHEGSRNHAASSPRRRISSCRPEYGVGVAQRCVEQVAAWGSFHRSVEYEIVFHFVASHKAAPEPPARASIMSRKHSAGSNPRAAAYSLASNSNNCGCPHSRAKLAHPLLMSTSPKRMRLMSTSAKRCEPSGRVS